MYGFHVIYSYSPSLVLRARPLNCPGWNLKGVKLLQSHDDAKEIHASCQGHKVVVIGASFIGCQIHYHWIQLLFDYLVDMMQHF